MNLIIIQKWVRIGTKPCEWKFDPQNNFKLLDKSNNLNLLRYQSRNRDLQMVSFPAAQSAIRLELLSDMADSCQSDAHAGTATVNPVHACGEALKLRQGSFPLASYYYLQGLYTCKVNWACNLIEPKWLRVIMMMIDGQRSQSVEPQKLSSSSTLLYKHAPLRA